MGLALSPMQVRSPAFENHGRIPKKHTGEGEDVSPALEWSDAPDDVEAFSVTSIPEGGGGRYTEGRGDFGKDGYGGPMPPEGHGVHHYFFWVLALDKTLDLEAGLTMEQLLKKIEPHVIGMNRIVGTYQRG